MDKLIIRNKTDSLEMGDLLPLAAHVNLKDEEFDEVMAVTFQTGTICQVKRNKQSITMTFYEGSGINA